LIAIVSLLPDFGTVCSIGGFTVLSTAAKYPELVKGLVLLNVAGNFTDKDKKASVVSGSDITGR
jgi:pimeloyl-ACP methyl ester carboxylesterase